MIMVEKTEQLKAWLAGFFDGEGSALIEKTGERYYQIVVAISGTVESISEEIMTMWGGRYRNNRDLNTWCRDDNSIRRKDCTVYFSDVNEAYTMLADIIPYLRLKQEDAIIVLKALLVAKEHQVEGRKAKRYSHLLKPYYQELKSLRAQRT